VPEIADIAKRTGLTSATQEPVNLILQGHEAERYYMIVQGEVEVSHGLMPVLTMCLMTVFLVVLFRS
jgi:hypothetical protein